MRRAGLVASGFGFAQMFLNGGHVSLAASSAQGHFRSKVRQLLFLRFNFRCGCGNQHVEVISCLVLGLLRQFQIIVGGRLEGLCRRERIVELSDALQENRRRLCARVTLH